MVEPEGGAGGNQGQPNGRRAGECRGAKFGAIGAPAITAPGSATGEAIAVDGLPAAIPATGPG